ncbi:vancomycin high temperature exclusion protein [Legionella steigerwaltii]|uniref:Vancomycin high temperature exclusion protein n=1 Tax=Legionella steigerwaltii TaxID=460 RepID=A0A378LBM3_9GAMM|nr:YdcF family protein [Legionella steigerwaltii]KTD75363.1 vancomycin high temperature exclusion protein [Legionella steigerwaltii]STY23720.1 vancomycin high temperature exclusion protein [Legionella steigerwaltii]
MKLFMQISIVILFSLLVIYLFLAVYVSKTAESDEKKRADVILVLGTKAYCDNSYNPCLVARVKHAVDLYKAHYAPKLLFSGGNNREDGINEAQTMKEIALSLGVPGEDILLESSSTTTYENLLLSKQLFQTHQLKTIILVTEPFHAPRAILVAQKFGLDVVSSPAVKSICWTKHKYLSRYFLKEPLAIMFYKMKNQL